MHTQEREERGGLGGLEAACRAHGGSCNRQTPPTHAAHFLMQAYGQIVFANSGWNLRFERLREYAETTSIKRSHLHQHLQRLREAAEQERADISWCGY